GGTNNGNYASSKVTFINCDFLSGSGGHAVHFYGSTGGELVFTDCLLRGFSSFASSITKITMDKCTIEGNGLDGQIKLHQDTDLKDCTFDLQNVDNSHVFGINAQSGATVTLINSCNCVIPIELWALDGAKIVRDDGTILAEHTSGEYEYIPSYSGFTSS
ncbi:hypothetical protein J5991_01720, partial [Methanocorpusculum sp.]|nr:hypothetical protein [Methanocorpusculum sp.]